MHEIPQIFTKPVSHHSIAQISVSNDNIISNTDSLSSRIHQEQLDTLLDLTFDAKSQFAESITLFGLPLITNLFSIHSSQYMPALSVVFDVISNWRPNTTHDILDVEYKSQPAIHNVDIQSIKAKFMDSKDKLIVNASFKVLSYLFENYQCTPSIKAIIGIMELLFSVRNGNGDANEFVQLSYEHTSSMINHLIKLHKSQNDDTQPASTHGLIYLIKSFNQIPYSVIKSIIIRFNELGIDGLNSISDALCLAISRYGIYDESGSALKTDVKF